MKENRIVLTMEGLPKEGGHIRLSDFKKELDSFISVVAQAEELISGKSRSFYYVITGLSHSSPATVTLEPRPLEQGFDISEATHEKVFRAFDAIRSGVQPRDKSEFYLFESIMHMLEPVGKTLSTLNLSRNGDSVVLDEELKSKVDLYMEPEETCPGAYRGMLEYINLHNQKNIFRLYPRVGPPKINCHFPPELLDTAIKAIGRRVEISGILRYKSNAPYPHEAEVKSLEIFPHDDDLPKFDDLIGADPDVTGDLSSEEFVRNIRHGEE